MTTRRLRRPNRPPSPKQNPAKGSIAAKQKARKSFKASLRARRTVLAKAEADGTTVDEETS